MIINQEIACKIIQILMAHFGVRIHVIDVFVSSHRVNINAKVLGMVKFANALLSTHATQFVVLYDVCNILN